MKLREKERKCLRKGIRVKVMRMARRIRRRIISKRGRWHDEAGESSRKEGT
jgi:hypothetical protein